MKRVFLFFGVMLAMSCSKTDVDLAPAGIGESTTKSVNQLAFEKELMRLLVDDNVLFDLILEGKLSVELLDEFFHQENWTLDFESIQVNLRASDSERLYNYLLALQELSHSPEQELLFNVQLERLAEQIVTGWEMKFGQLFEGKADNPCRRAAAQNALSVMASGFSMMGGALAFGPAAPAVVMGGVVGTCVGAGLTWLISSANC